MIGGCFSAVTLNGSGCLTTTGDDGSLLMGVICCVVGGICGSGGIVGMCVGIIGTTSISMFSELFPAGLVSEFSSSETSSAAEEIISGVSDVTHKGFTQEAMSG